MIQSILFSRVAVKRSLRACISVNTDLIKSLGLAYDRRDAEAPEVLEWYRKKGATSATPAVTGEPEAPTTTTLDTMKLLVGHVRCCSLLHPTHVNTQFLA